MKTIYKYKLEPKKVQVITLSKTNSILNIQMQGDSPVLWAIVDREAINCYELEQITLYTFMTGESINEKLLETLSYVGTYQDANGYVFHVFKKETL